MLNVSRGRINATIVFLRQRDIRAKFVVELRLTR